MSVLTTDPANPTKLLCADSIYARYRYQDPPVLKGANLCVNRGESVAIMGPSGCGKSTLLAHLAGLRKVQAGVVKMGQHDLSLLHESQLEKLRAEHIGFIFQRAYLLPYLTVHENISIALKAAPARASEDDIAALLKRMGLTEFSDRVATDLSVGQAQRVAVARALIKQPDIIFADEPTGSLDGDNVALITKMLLQGEQTIVVSTHDERVAAACDRVVHLRDGQLHDA